MAQQNSMRVACELTFKQTMYAYYINYITSNFMFLEINLFFQDLKWQLKWIIQQIYMKSLLLRV